MVVFIIIYLSNDNKLFYIYKYNFNRDLLIIFYVFGIVLKIVEDFKWVKYIFNY